jgi:hypothetical protein
MKLKALPFIAIFTLSACSSFNKKEQRNIANILDIFQYRNFEQRGEYTYEVWNFPEDISPKKMRVENAFRKHVTSKTFYDCSVQFSDNDDKKMACVNYKGDYTAIIGSIGSRKVFHKLENLSRFITPEIESSYETIYMVNTANRNTGANGFIPPQHMLVVKRNPKNGRFFTRNAIGTINGLQRGTKNVYEVLKNYRKGIKKYARSNRGGIVKKNGLHLVPISSGLPGDGGIYSFSGIFQINEGKSVRLNDKVRRQWTSEAPMTNAMYVGYFYNKRDGSRGRSSGLAIHGTPSWNWKLLGKSRASHGCIRTHPYIAKAMFNTYMDSAKKTVPEFDWDQELAVIDNKDPYKRRRPALIILFNGYSAKSI